MDTVNRQALRDGRHCATVRAVVAADHVTVYRRCNAYTRRRPSTRPTVPALAGGEMVMYEDHVKISGRWGYLHGAVDQFEQITDASLSA